MALTLKIPYRAFWGVLKFAVGLLLLFLLLWLFAVWIQFPGFHDRIRGANLSNIKQINFAMLMYVENNDGRFPPQMSTMEQLQPVLIDYVLYEELFQTVNERGSEFLWNKRLAGRLEESIAYPDRTISLYDSELWKDTGERACVFVDNHAKYVDDDYFEWGLKVDFDCPPQLELPVQP